VPVELAIFAYMREREITGMVIACPGVSTIYWEVAFPIRTLVVFVGSDWIMASRILEELDEIAAATVVRDA
jgi:hypothetical protein